MFESGVITPQKEEEKVGSKNICLATHLTMGSSFGVYFFQWASFFLS